MRRATVRGAIVVATIVATLAACGKSDSTPAGSSAQAAAPAAGPGATTSCPATGLWAECSVVYHLERAGLAPKVEATDTTPEEKLLNGKMFVVKIGQLARLEVYLYSDSAARVADERSLDRTKFVNDTAEQTIRRERTLIESANLIGLLTSLNSHQRQRVGDVLAAGPPQPAGR